MLHIISYLISLFKQIIKDAIISQNIWSWSDHFSLTFSYHSATVNLSMKKNRDYYEIQSHQHFIHQGIIHFTD